MSQSGKKIECYPAMTSTPPSRHHQPLFNPSNPASPEENAKSVQRALDPEMQNLEGDKVSPESSIDISKTDTKASTNLKTSKQEGEGGDGDDSDIKLVDADGNTLPKTGSVTMSLTKKNGQYQVKGAEGSAGEEDKGKTAKGPRGKQSKNNKANVTLGKKEEEVKTSKVEAALKEREENQAAAKAKKEKERAEKAAKAQEEADRKQREKDQKARKTLSGLVAQAQMDADQATMTAQLKAERAKATGEESDKKAADKAKQNAVKADAKLKNLKAKYDEMVAKADQLKKLSGDKRTAEDQSPGKEGGGEENWTEVKGVNVKKKPKEDSKEDSKTQN